MQILGSINLTEILAAASFPEPIPGGSLGGAFALDDNNIAIFYGRSSYVKGSGFSVLIVSTNGKFTWFSSPYLGEVAGNNYYISSIIPFGLGRYLVTMTTAAGGPLSYFLNIKNFGLNNRIPYLLFPSKSPTNISCYNVPSFYAYDGVNKLLGIASYNPIGQNGGPCYSSTYSVSATNLVQIGGGFVGYYTSGSNAYDPYNQTKTGFNGTIVANSSVNQSNGISTVLGYNTNLQYFIGRNTYKVNVGVGITDCVTPNESFVNSKSFYSFFQNNVNSVYNNNFDSNVPGIVGGNNPNGSPTNTPAVQLFDLDNNIADILYNISINPAWTVVTNLGVFMLDNLRNIYYSSFSVNNYFRPFVNRTPHPLANFSHSAQNVFFRS